MRGKRSKTYRKLMDSYALAFNFRQPYQVVVDSELLKDCTKWKYDILAGLQRTLHGEVKPFISQCEIRKLYKDNKDPVVAAAIETAKRFERRRCGHHPDEYPEPVPDCLSHMVDPSGSGVNTHRYCVAANDLEVRRKLRRVKGVPLIYVARSNMVLEPMSDVSSAAKMKGESVKFKSGLRSSGVKRKRDDEDGEPKGGDGDGESSADDGGEGDGSDEEAGASSADEGTPGSDGTGGPARKKKKRNYGPKGPNPLATKKSKKKSAGGDDGRRKAPAPRPDAAAASQGKRKRKRKPKAAGDGTGGSTAVATEA